MVDKLQGISDGGLAQTNLTPNYSTNASRNYLQALTDAVVLSAQARAVMVQMSTRQTVAEAWLDQLSQPPDLTQSIARAGTSASADGKGDGKDNALSLQRAMGETMGNLSWLFDAMSPPRVDTAAVAQALAQRMAADAVGVNPPLPQAVAHAEKEGATAALHISNLTVTVGGGQGTTASVERVAVTTIDPSLGQSLGGRDRPLVVDMGGDVQQLADQGTPGSTAGTPPEGMADDRRRALLVVRQGGRARPEGTLHVSLDVLLPLT
jgi:hypothetical protein